MVYVGENCAIHVPLPKVFLCINFRAAFLSRKQGAVHQENVYLVGPRSRRWFGILIVCMDNHMVFLVQFGINLHKRVFFKKMKLHEPRRRVKFQLLEELLPFFLTRKKLFYFFLSFYMILLA